jgi:hypothetical protein
MRSPPLTPDETALAAVYLLRQYETETGKELSRFRISRTTLRFLSLHSNLREDFITQWIDAIARWGWIAFVHGEEFALIHNSSTAGWVQVGAKRLADERNKLLKEEDEERERRLRRWKVECAAHFTSKESEEE